MCSPRLYLVRVFKDFIPFLPPLRVEYIIQAVSHFVKYRTQGTWKEFVRVDEHVYSVFLIAATPAQGRLASREPLFI